MKDVALENAEKKHDTIFLRDDYQKHGQYIYLYVQIDRVFGDNKGIYNYTILSNSI